MTEEFIICVCPFNCQAPQQKETGDKTFGANILVDTYRCSNCHRSGKYSQVERDLERQRLLDEELALRAKQFAENKESRNRIRRIQREKENKAKKEKRQVVWKTAILPGQGLVQTQEVPNR